LDNLKVIWQIVCDKALLIRAIKIALIVGIILNMINQGEHIISLEFSQIHFLKFTFTFTVPFCVSMYTAVSMKIKYHVGDFAAADATLKCKKCKEKIDIKRNEVIPFCKTCKEKTSWKIKSIKV